MITMNKYRLIDSETVVCPFGGEIAYAFLKHNVQSFNSLK